MPDEPTVSQSSDRPVPDLVRILIDRYWSVWERVQPLGSRPSAADVLSAIPERERDSFRDFLTGFDALVNSARAPAAVKPDTIHKGPEKTVVYAPYQPVASADHAMSYTGDFTPSTADLPNGAAGQGTQSPSGMQIPGYDILDELGHGGMGIVFKARHKRLQRLVAIKLMLQADYAGKTARDRFDAEAQVVARMQHPNIVQVFEVGEIDGKPFFSLEFVDGGTLSEKVAKNLMRPKETATMMVTLARAIHYAHEHGIVHRDLKPGNVLLTEDGAPKIADFGLAKKLEEDSGMTRMGTIVGTPSFMPPEQAAGEVNRVGKSADIYSLGAILYDLLTGRPPFKGANVIETLQLVRSQEPLAPSSLQPGVPRDLETICLKCLQKDPARRYATAAELADDLQRYLKGEPILARPIGTPERIWRWCKRNQRVAALLGAVAVLLILITAGSTTAAIFINNSRNQIREQRDEIGQQKSTIAGQLVEITAKEKLAKDRLEAYREGVDAFVNEAPSILEGYPLARAPSEELLQLTVKLLEDAQGKANDAGLTDRGRLSILLRQSELARAQGNYDEAARLLAESHQLAVTLAAPGQPERDKSAGNLALVLNLQAAVARGKRDFAHALALHEQALRQQQDVLDHPESGEIPPEEARTWIANTLFSIAETRSELAKTLRDPQAARRERTQARRSLEQAEPHLKAAIPKVPPRQAERLTNRLGVAALEYGRISEKLDDLDGAGDGFGDAVATFQKLVQTHPSNLMYKQNLSVAAAEYGDILLIKRKDFAKARQMYTFAVFYLLPIARPSELDSAVNTLAINYYRVATAARMEKDEANAKRLYGLCLEIREAQLRAAERRAASEKAANPPYVGTAKINLMFAQARFGQYKEAAAIANEVANRVRSPIGQSAVAMATSALNGSSGEVLATVARLAREFPQLSLRQFNAACGFGLSAIVVPAGDPERAKLLDLAFKNLFSALKLGYHDRETIEQDPDVEPLRSDPRFQEVLELLAKSQPAKK